MPSLRPSVCPLRGRVDPRLLRFSAGATACTLAVVLLIMDVARPLGLGLLASQVAVFAFTAFVSFQWSLWAHIFARFIWPRIEPPTELEDARPARFAQFFGFVFTALALSPLRGRHRCPWLRPDCARLRSVRSQRIHRAVFGLQGLPARSADQSRPELRPRSSVDRESTGLVDRVSIQETLGPSR